jgi:hypothetical protein
LLTKSSVVLTDISVLFKSNLKNVTWRNNFFIDQIHLQTWVILSVKIKTDYKFAVHCKTRVNFIILISSELLTLSTGPRPSLSRSRVPFLSSCRPSRTSQQLKSPPKELSELRRPVTLFYLLNRKLFDCFRGYKLYTYVTDKLLKWSSLYPMWGCLMQKN